MLAIQVNCGMLSSLAPVQTHVCMYVCMYACMYVCMYARKLLSIVTSAIYLLSYNSCAKEKSSMLPSVRADQSTWYWTESNAVDPTLFLYVFMLTVLVLGMSDCHCCISGPPPTRTKGCTLSRAAQGFRCCCSHRTVSTCMCATTKSVVSRN